MRVISGLHKGKKLLYIDDKQVRPTTDRAKETIFNLILHHYKSNLQNKNILDLFAGSGALGIECLSRGASFVLFVDNYVNSLKLLEKNLSKLTYQKFIDYKILQCDSQKLKFHTYDKKFSIVFLDPPYDSSLIEESIPNLLKQDICEKDCIFVVESNKDFLLDNLKLNHSKIIGHTYVKIYSIDN
jgi:16S rRNA (guanine966-N2)-methyltransferase